MRSVKIGVLAAFLAISSAVILGICINLNSGAQKMDDIEVDGGILDKDFDDKKVGSLESLGESTSREDMANAEQTIKEEVVEKAAKEEAEQIVTEKVVEEAVRVVAEKAAAEEIVREEAVRIVAEKAAAEEIVREEAVLAAEQALEEAYLLANLDAFASAANYVGVDTYPWKDDCPGRADTYVTVINDQYVGGNVCESVSYVGWKAYERYGIYLSWGNSNTWDNVGRAKGIVDHIPAAQSIAQTDTGYYGHVAWVESVNVDGSINITEYNNAYSSVSGAWHDFGSRVIPASQVSSYNFIHIDRL